MVLFSYFTLVFLLSTISINNCQTYTGLNQVLFCALLIMRSYGHETHNTNMYNFIYIYIYIYIYISQFKEICQYRVSDLFLFECKDRFNFRTSVTVSRECLIVLIKCYYFIDCQRLFLPLCSFSPIERHLYGKFNMPKCFLPLLKTGSHISLHYGDTVKLETISIIPFLLAFSRNI